MTLKEPLQTLEPTLRGKLAAPAALNDRRRPDRLRDVSPHLIPLLRTSPTQDAFPGLSSEEGIAPFEDELTPARGIALGLVLSVPLWVIIGGVAWAVL